MPPGGFDVRSAAGASPRPRYRNRSHAEPRRRARVPARTVHRNPLLRPRKAEPVRAISCDAVDHPGCRVDRAVDCPPDPQHRAHGDPDHRLARWARALAWHRPGRLCAVDPAHVEGIPGPGVGVAGRWPDGTEAAQRFDAGVTGTAPPPRDQISSPRLTSGNPCAGSISTFLMAGLAATLRV